MVLFSFPCLFVRSRSPESIILWEMLFQGVILRRQLYHHTQSVLLKELKMESMQLAIYVAFFFFALFAHLGNSCSQTMQPSLDYLQTFSGGQRRNLLGSPFELDFLFNGVQRFKSFPELSIIGKNFFIKICIMLFFLIFLKRVTLQSNLRLLVNYLAPLYQSKVSRIKVTLHA